MKNNKFEIPVYSFLLVFCGVFFYGTFFIKAGRAKTVSDSFVPRLTIGLMAILLVILLVKAIMASKTARAAMTDEEKAKEKEELKYFASRMGILIVILTATIIMMQKLGFIIAMSFYLLVMFIWLAEDKKPKWKVILPIALLFPLALFMVYLRVFSVLLPAGVLKFLT